MADGLQINTESQAQGLLVFPEAPSVPALDPNTARIRADKAVNALGSNVPSVDQLTASILSGNEDEERRRAAIRQDLLDARKQQSMARDYIDTKKKMGLPITSEDWYTVTQMTREQKNDPATFFEKKFGEAALAEATRKDSRTDPTSEAIKPVVASQQYAIKLLEDLEAEIANDSTLSNVLDHAQRFVPGMTWYHMQNALKGLPASGSFLLGNNLEDQIKSYYLQGDKGMANLKATVDELKAKNKVDARDYLSSFIAFTSNDQLMSNLLSAADLSMLAPAPLGIAPRAATLASGAVLAKDVARSLAVRSPSPTAVLEASGQVAESALTKLWATVDKKAQGPGAGLAELKDSVPSLANPQALLDGSTGYSETFKNTLLTTLQRQAYALVEGTLDKPINIERLKPGTPAFDTALQEARESMMRARPELDGSVVGTSFRHDPISNTDYLTATLGGKTGEFFDTAENAHMMATDMYKLVDYRVGQIGGKFAILVDQPINETSKAVRNALIETKNQTPNSLMSRIFGFARMADSLLPESLVTEGKAAMYGSSSISSLIKANAKPIAALNKESRNRLTAFTEYQRDFVDKETGLRGRFSQNLGQFEKEWMSKFGQMPTEKEAQAYFTYTQISDTDWLARNVQQKAIDSRLGLQMWHFPVENVELKVAPQIKGRIVKDIDWQSGDAGLVIWSSNPAEIRYIRTARTQTENAIQANIARNVAIEQARSTQMVKEVGASIITTPGNMGSIESSLAAFKKLNVSSYSREEIQEMIESGSYKLIQLTPEGEKRLRSMPLAGDVLKDYGNIHYVLSREAEFSNVPFKQVNYRPGGHVDYYEGFFVRQPIMSISQRGMQESSTYFGDKNLFHFETEADARLFTDRMNEARRLFNEGTPEQLKAYMEKNLPKIDMEALFHEEKGEFKRNLPFMYSKKGVGLDEAHKLEDIFKGYKNGRDSPFNPYNGSPFNSFTQEKDRPLLTIVKGGTEEEPKYGFRNGRLINPIETMQDAALQVMNGKYLGDLKIKYAEHFIQEFGPVLKASAEELRANPFNALFKGEFKTHGDPELLAAARNFRRTAIQFFGLRTDWERSMDAVKQKAIDLLYTKVGPEGANRVESAINVLDEHLLGTIKDPVKFMRGFAFHTKLGLFNPTQFFLQAANFVHVAGVEGIAKATQAFSAYNFMRAAMINPDHLERLSGMASKFGWSKDNFKESFEWLQRTGFANVAGEHANLDDFLRPAVVRSKLGEFADGAAVFFKEGERVGRMTAWNAAYLRWKELNPGAVLDAAGAKEILARADMNTMSMSRFSNAGYQQGVLSVPTQFFAYQAHMAELLLGKKLTSAEKARLFMVNSMTYGAPVAAGAFTGIWPLHESIKKYALDNGMNPQDNDIANMVVHGIPAVVGKYIYGTQYNVGERYGPGGLTQFKDLLRGDKGTLDFLFGASGSAAKDAFKSMQPFAYWLMSPFHQNEDHLPLKAQDFLGVLDNISAYSNIKRGVIAAVYGEYMTKNGIKLDMEPAGAVGGFFSAMTGLQPQDILDTYAKIEVGNDIKNARKDAEKEAGKWYRLALEAASNGNEVEAADYLRRTKIALIPGRYLPTEHAQVFKRIIDNNEALVDKVGAKFSQQSPERMESYIKHLERRGK